MTAKKRKYQGFLILGRLCVVWLSVIAFPEELYAQDSTRTEPYEPSRRSTFRPSDRYGDPFSSTPNETPLMLDDPSQHELELEIDTGLNYTIYEKIGNVPYRPITTMSFEEFRQYQERQMLKNYWRTQSRALDGESAVSGRGFTPKIFVSPVLDRIFGGSYVELVPRGFVTLDFGASFQRINNPQIPIRQQRNGGFEFDQQINMNVTGKVGEKLAVTANFDNNNSFDFQNNMKVEYTGFKEDVLQKLEIGNVSLPLNNTLIQGAQNLFGVKAQMQFGKLDVTSIASTQRGKASSIEIPGGGSGQGRPFEIIASNYDENRHFFLGHFFRDNYSKWIAIPSQVSSGVIINQVEVYVLNRNNDTKTLRNVVGLMDLAEGRRIYNDAVVTGNGNVANANGANDLFSMLTGLSRDVDGVNGSLEGLGLTNGTDFEKVTGARKLADTEFTFHPQLGYITLTRKLQNDEVLAVAYSYTYNGQPYQVGELTKDYSKLKDDEVVFLKLLRPRKIAVRDEDEEIIPTWDLMMKNIYSLNVSQLQREDFELRIIYRDDRTGIDNPQLQEGGSEVRNRQLVEIFGLDKLNPVNDPQRDGNFDFVEGVTINSETGLIIFPMLSPFSEALRTVFAGQPSLIQKYAYDTLYRTTKAQAELFSTKNKFYLVGQYSAGSAKEILIPGFGVSEGSVRVYAGGIPLQENTQYTVDYTFGKVTILDEGILSSGKNITIQYEQSDPFAFQTRTLLGSRFDYHLSEDINLGSTVLYYNERPLVSRNQIGTEPARNLMYGVDFNVNKSSRMLTKIVDALPLIQTKEQSSVNLSGEFAQLLPGTSNVVDGEGVAYLDDFENTATPYSLMSPAAWKLSSIPKTDDYRYDPSNGATNAVEAGYQRAKLAWYQVDNLFYRSGGGVVSKPSNIPDQIKNHYERGVVPQEIFPNRSVQQAVYQEPIFDIAYYPFERGPYNYNPNLDANGFLKNPAQNWGAITNAIRTEVDFDKANIEYVEFWLLDPFITTENGKIDDGFNTPTNNTTGGKLVFQLGSISEDVMRDSKHAFENGMPEDGDLTTSVTQNEWGYVTDKQYITNAFDNSSKARANQDVGLDGVPDEKEATTFSDFMSGITGISADALTRIQQDPSADDFQYFLGSELDDVDAGILQRYKSYNGMDGNTPVTGTDLVARSGSPYPDNEDLNSDNTLSELEEYYEYDIDLKPGQLAIGDEYIVDKITNTIESSNEQVSWYLYRIPIRDFERKFGAITGFKSIRYMRMLLTGFQQPVVLRFANFRMIGSRWRRYTEALWESGLQLDTEPDLENFTVSVVNLEDNAQPDPANGKSGYTIPPGVVRDRDNSSTVGAFLNEQSVQLCVDNLADGDARAVYKNFDADLFNYGRLKMFFHADSESEDDELTAFIRLGTDFTENYYEVEIPLKISEIVTNPQSNERAVWPEANEIDIDLDALTALKVRRDREGASLTAMYENPDLVDGRHRVRILGRPDLSAVTLVMIGVRNPRTSDRASHSACIWANELRLTDFDRTAGWAVNGTLSAKLADFATVTGAFRHTTFGFGSVSSKIGERNRDETTSYDVAAHVNLDKLLPGDTGIKVPMFVSYEKSISNPNYDPANPDVRLDAALKSFTSSEEKENYLGIIRDQTVRRSLNFTNVRKEKVNPESRSHIYDVENLSFSYSYSEAKQSNFNIKESLQRRQAGSVAYNFSPKATGIEPFRNMKGLKSPYLRLIKDFNIGLMPNSLGARADLDRSFQKTVYRNDEGVGDEANYQKYFLFNRTYNLRWAFSKGLTLDYNSRVNAVIDEPEGDIDTQEKRDSVLTNLKRFGRMKNFDQNFTVNYTVPLDKIPLTDWVGMDYRYQGSYNWKAGPVNIPDDEAARRDVQDIADSLDFKNTIQNSREQNYSGRLDLVKLYNKVKFLKEINTPKRKAPVRQPSRTPQRSQPTKEDTVKVPGVPPFIKGLARMLMSLRSITGSYTVTEGTVLPGFSPTPRLFGMDQDFNAPGWGFILGEQDPEFQKKAAKNGWLVENANLTYPFSQVKNISLNIRANIEPTADLKIQIDLKKDANTTYQEIFRYDTTSMAFESISPTRGGSYKISSNMIRTSFKSDNSEKESSVFETFKENLAIVRQRFATITGQPEFDSASQDVLIPAFIAAYSGKEASTLSLSPFPSMPMPNWRIEYAGLSKLEAFSNIFQSVTISHGYTSFYTVTSYNKSVEYESSELFSINRSVEDYNKEYFSQTIDGNLVPMFSITQVLMSEQFSPLIGINVRTKNRVTGKVEYKVKRDLALNISNAQVTELNSKEIGFDIGFTKNNMKLPFRSQGRTIVLKNDVTFRMNMAVSDTKTIQRKLEEEGTVTNGNVNFQLRPNVSYAVNQKLNVQAYFERTINSPLISNSYRRATTRFGVQVRFNLAQE